MVATRRPARRSESEAESHVPAAGAELTSVEGSTCVRTTRSRSKINSHSGIIPESQSEKMKESETKSGVEESLETQKTLNRSKALCLADSVAELQADADISEAESNCSSVSGLHTPMFIRITRRRKIMVPCQPESASKNRQSKKTLPNEGSKYQEDEDISEAESCSSTVSGVRPLNTPRKTRSQQVKASVLPVCESQAEEVSDAESWCSGVSTEPSVPFKRITRSMRVKSQLETTLQSERKSEVVVGDEKLPECVTKSLTIVISDSEQPTKSDLETEKASCTQNNEHPSPCKTKCHSESVISSDPKQIMSSSPKKLERECAKKSPKKERPKDKDYECVDGAELKVGKDKDVSVPIAKQISDDIYEVEEVCDQNLEKARKVTDKTSPVKNTDLFPHNHRSLEKPDKFLRQETPNKSKNKSEPPKTDRRVMQSCFHNAEEVIDVDKVPTGSPQNEIIPIQTIESSDDDCRVSVSSVDSDENQEEPDAESSSCGTKKARDEKCFSASFLISDDSDDSENSDLEEINGMDMIASGHGTNNKNVLDKSLHEELFVIDKTPGLDSSKAYYLEEKEKNLEDDKESEKSEESSELEDSEEEFIDEDEDLLTSNNKTLSFSSSIDPGLNVKQLGGLYISFDTGKQKPGSHGIVPLKEKKKDELLQKSIITPDFEKKDCIPPLKESARQLKKQRRAEREKTTGDGWFGMKAPEMTEELKNDLHALKMRAAMDPKRFYKKNDRKGLPKYFQVGTVVDSPADFYHARIPKKERKKNIVEELLADSEFRRYNKRKYQDIMSEKAAQAAGKKNLKKKKFRK